MNNPKFPQRPNRSSNNFKNNSSSRNPNSYQVPIKPNDRVPSVNRNGNFAKSSNVNNLKMKPGINNTNNQGPNNNYAFRQKEKPLNNATYNFNNPNNQRIMALRQKAKRKKQVLVATTVVVLSLATIGAALSSSLYFFVFNKQKATIINITTVKNSQAWDDFITNHNIENLTNIESIQALVDENKNEWKNWLSPVDEKNEINNDAIKSVTKVEVMLSDSINKNQDFLMQLRFKFTVEWNTNYEASNLYKDPFMMGIYEIFDFDWIEEPSEVRNNVQTWINQSLTPINNVERLEAFVNQTKNAEIKQLLTNNEQIETLSFVATQVNNGFNLETNIVPKNKIVVNLIADDITDLRAKTNEINVEWKANAQGQIQNLINVSTTPLLTASQIQSHLDTKKSEIQALLTENEHIESINLIVGGNGPNGFTLNVTIILESGYNQTGTIEQITNLTETKKELIISWTNNAQSEIQNLINVSTTPLLTASQIQTYLDTKKGEIQNLLTPNDKIITLTLTVSGNGPAEFNLNASVTLEQGYTQLGTISTIENLSETRKELTITWVSNAQTQIQNLINSSLSPLINASQIQTHLNTKKTEIQNLLTPNEKINALTLNVAGSGPDQFTLSINVTLEDGYVQLGTIATISGLEQKLNLIEISWINDAQVQIQNLINNSPTPLLNDSQIEAYLNTKKSEIENLLTPNERIVELDLIIGGSGPEGFTLDVNPTLEQGYDQAGAIPQITNLNETRKEVTITWVANAQTTIQDLINASPTALINELQIKEYLDTKKTEIQLLLTPNDKVSAINLEVTSSGVNQFSLRVSPTLQSGYDLSNELTPINGLNGKTQTVAINWVDNAKAEIQNLINLSASDLNTTQQIKTYLDENIDEIRGLLTSSNLITSLTLTVGGSAPNQFTLDASVDLEQGYTQTGTISQITGLAQKDEVTEINWVANAQTIIQGLINTSENSLTEISQIQTLLDTKKTEIIALLTPQEAIQSIDLTIGGQGPNNFTLTVIPQLKGGYAQPSLVDTIQGLQQIKWELELEWLDNAEQGIQELIDSSPQPLTTADQMKEWLNTTNNKIEIISFLTDADKLYWAEVTSLVETGVDQFSLQVAAIVKNPDLGYSIANQPPILTGLKASRIEVAVDWKDPLVVAKTKLQDLINEANLTSAVAIKNHLDLQKEVIKQLLTSANQIETFDIEVNGSETYILNITNIIYKEGFVSDGSLVTTITGLTNSTNQIVIDWIDLAAAKKEIQSGIDNNHSGAPGAEGLENYFNYTFQVANFKPYFINGDKVNIHRVNVEQSGESINVFLVTFEYTVDSKYELIGEFPQLDGINDRPRPPQPGSFTIEIN